MNYQWGKDSVNRKQNKISPLIFYAEMPLISLKDRKKPAVHVGQTGFLNFFYLSETDILIYPK